MILIVSQHAMWGLKISPQNNEIINKTTTYKIILDNQVNPTFKNPNRCNELINKDIQNWIIENGYNKYSKRNPPKFLAKLDSNDTITIKERII